MQDYSHSSSVYLPVMTWKARRLALNVWNPPYIVQLTIMSLWCGLSLFKDNLLFSGQPVERSGLVALLGTTPLWWQSHSIRHQVPKSPCTTPLRREVKRSVLLLALVSSYFSLTSLPVPLWGGFVKRERIISDNLAMFSDWTEAEVRSEELCSFASSRISLFLPDISPCWPLHSYIRESVELR